MKISIVFNTKYSTWYRGEFLLGILVQNFRWNTSVEIGFVFFKIMIQF